MKIFCSRGVWKAFAVFSFEMRCIGGSKVMHVTGPSATIQENYRYLIILGFFCIILNKTGRKRPRKAQECCSAKTPIRQAQDMTSLYVYQSVQAEQLLFLFDVNRCSYYSCRVQ